MSSKSPCLKPQVHIRAFGKTKPQFYPWLLETRPLLYHELLPVSNWEGPSLEQRETRTFSFIPSIRPQADHRDVRRRHTHTSPVSRQYFISVSLQSLLFDINRSIDLEHLEVVIQRTYIHTEFNSANKERATGCVPASTWTRPKNLCSVQPSVSFREDDQVASEEVKAALNTSGRARETLLFSKKAEMYRQL